MSILPYPPAPEPGWYDDDATVLGTLAHGNANERTPADSSTGSGSPAAGIADQPEAVEDWDGTVLSSAFTAKSPHKQYGLHNEITGQDIVIDQSVLLGRKPSAVIPEGVKAIRLEDPTRTISRNHVAVSFDQDEALWIEDYGSLNGTYVIHGTEETQVTKDAPIKLDAPATLRIGDQFFNLEERE